MTLEQVVGERKIVEILHFTTNKGLLGTLATRSLKSRQRLRKEDYLEHIYTPNCDTRKDLQWLDHVSLSISSINTGFYEICSGKWHRDKDFWWCILSFRSEILLHDDVHFATTNNIYSGVTRAKGLKGLESLFRTPIHQFGSKYAHRRPNTPPNQPTDIQAEVLYPGEVSTEHLHAVYVASDEHSDSVHGIRASVDHALFEVLIDKQRFA